MPGNKPRMVPCLMTSYLVDADTWQTYPFDSSLRLSETSECCVHTPGCQAVSSEVVCGSEATAYDINISTDYSSIKHSTQTPPRTKWLPNNVAHVYPNNGTADPNNVPNFFLPATSYHTEINYSPASSTRPVLGGPGFTATSPSLLCVCNQSFMMTSAEQSCLQTADSQWHCDSDCHKQVTSCHLPTP